MRVKYCILEIFQMFKLPFLFSRYLVFNSLKTTLSNLRDHKEGPTLHIIESNCSCKEFLFVKLLFKSDNISPTTVRGGTWVNDITKYCCTYREILSLLLELFVYSHMSNYSLLSGKKKKSFRKGIEEIYFCKNCMDRQFLRFDDSRADLKSCDNRIMTAIFCTA